MKNGWLSFVVLTILVLSTLLAAGSDLRAAEHPSLVSAEAAQCDSCHEDLLEDQPVLHSPATDDCTMCHEFSITEEGTTVELMEPEPALCLMCHSELESAAEMELEVPHMPVGDSCLTCHEPHASGNPRLLIAATASLCSECHDLQDLEESHEGQITPTVDCTSCHLPHGSENPGMLLASRMHQPFAERSCSGCHRPPFSDRIRLRARGERLCEACHGEFPTPDNGSIHAALSGDRSRAGCLSCHDPHMSDNTTLLVKSGVELCGQCHAAIVDAAEAETGHYAAAEDCTSCHLPHTSEYARLLSDPPDQICGNCHDLEDTDLSAAHLGADLSRLSCTSCHTPHGAGHPSLLATNLHPPVEDGCDICHEGAFNELMDDGEASLCLMCHEDIGEIAENAAVPHAAMELGSCTECHNPHASPQESLVKLPGAGPCAECHDEQAAGEGEVAHRVIDLLGCRACHEPHGGSNEKMLRLTGASLCLACHDPKAAEIDTDAETVRLLGSFEVPADLARASASLRLSAEGTHDHPIRGHRALGVPTAEELKATDASFSGELTCLTCHNPHKGKSEKILRWQAASPMEACRNCHEK